jgi:hypothetical protein
VFAAVLVALEISHAQERRPKATSDPAHRQLCQRNLTRIYDALDEYSQRYNKLPNWLSELTPDFISNPDVLFCPYVLKTGLLSEWRKRIQPGPGKDRRTSYHYEFCLEKAPYVLAEDNDKTYRDYKTAQMTLLREAVPIVRCLAHEPMLNLASNGLLFENIEPLHWEENFAHIYPHMLLVPRDLFPEVRRIGTPHPHLPHEAPAGLRGILDICEHFNIPLHELRGNYNRDNLASLPQGLQEFGGVNFSISGVLHLTRGSRNLPFPREVQGIVVNQHCARMHVLHGFVASEPVSLEAASLSIHYGAPPRQPASIPLPGSQSKVVWHTILQARGVRDRELVVHRTTWDNPDTANLIASVGFVSAMTEAAPFLLAITLE